MLPTPKLSSLSPLLKRLPRQLSLLVLTAGLLSALSASAQTVVTISNSGFENAGTAGQTFEYSLTADWNFQTTNSSTFRWIDKDVSGRTASDVHSGSRAYRITSPNTGGQAYIQQNSAARFAVNVGETYTVSLWAKGLNLDLAYDSIKISIEWWNAAGNGVVSTWNSPVLSLSANDAWEQLSVSSTAAPAGAATGKILIFFVHGASSAVVSPAITLDDISVFSTASIPEVSSFGLITAAVTLVAVGVIRRRKIRQER
ncbi:MAG: hypothetical protein WC205_07200 [Opitutaceae bacterium]